MTSTDAPRGTATQRHPVRPAETHQPSRAHVRVALTVIRSDQPQRHSVLIEAQAGTTWSQTMPHLRATLPDAMTSADTVTVGGTPVPDDAELGLPPLTWGQTLTVTDAALPPRPSPRGSSSRRPTGLHSLHAVSGFDAGRVWGLGRGNHLVGRSPEASVRLSDPSASRAHVQIHVDDEGITAAAVATTNPSLLDGDVLVPQPVALGPGATLAIGQSRLALGRFSGTPAAATWESGRRMVHRRPRITRPTADRTIDFPEAPSRREGMRMPMLAALAPVVVSGVLAWVTGSALMLLFALLSPVMMLSQWFSDRRHGRRSFRRASHEHRQTTEQRTHELRAALSEEASRRHGEHPDLAQVGLVVKALDSTLWQRSSRDSDHLVVRLGLADLPARTTVTGAPRPDLAAPVLTEVPCTVALSNTGVLGLAGPRERVLSLATGIVGQLLAWHSPHSLTLSVASTAATATDDWGWASGLAHLENDATGSSALRACTASGLGLPPRTAALLAARQAEREREPHAARPVPDQVVLLDGAHDLRRTAEVADLLRVGADLGFVVICLDTSAVRLPSECAATVLLDSGPSARGILSESSTGPTEFVADLPAADWIVGVADHLRPLDDATPGADDEALPNAVGFRRAHQQAGCADPLDPTALAERWQHPSPGARCLLGVAANGPYSIDLVTDGPHALVGGTTGSGKSELLRAFVAGLAAAYPPNALSFVLVDYKGGSAFRECARLPHVAGLVTDLDAHLTARALTSLDAEVKRRERAFSGVGASDFVDYQRLCPNPSDSIPRLVLVVDEFRMLADELPEFVDGLVRIAAVGRSLGIHLVLATQRPAGIVTGDMRANIALRIALRVRDSMDSEDVIESSEATRISERSPGRCQLRTAGLTLTEVQTAQVSRPLESTTDVRREPVVRRTDWTGRVLDDGGIRTAPTAAPSTGPLEPHDAETELTAFVRAATDAAHALGLERARSPWMAPLPGELDGDDLPTDPHEDLDAEQGDGAGIEPVHLRLGLADRPSEQRQVAFGWRPTSDGALGIAGGPRSGRTNALQAMALAVADTWSPVDAHVHVMTGSDGEWDRLRELPHLGSVTGAADPVRAAKALTRLRAELIARRSGGAGASTRARQFLLVDGWETLEEALDVVDHGAPINDLIALLREGQSVGVHVAITGGRQILVGRIAGLLGTRLALRMPDPLDLSMAGLAAGEIPTFAGPGRAVDLNSHDEVQLLNVSHLVASERAAAMGSRWAEASREDLPWQLRPLPSLVSFASLDTIARPQGRLAVGVSGDSLDPVGPDLGEGQRRVLVIGPRRSGRSHTLGALGRALLTDGERVAVVARPNSTLDRLPWTEWTAHGASPDSVLRIDPADASDAERLIAVRRAHPRLAVLVDDAEGITGQALEPALTEIAQLAHAAGGFIAAAVEVTAASALFRGLVPEIARDGVALTLSCHEPDSRDLLNARVARAVVPGRGHLVTPDDTVEVQLALP